MLMKCHLLMHANTGLHFCTKKLDRPPASHPIVPCPTCSIRGGDEAGDALHAPALRLRLLRSLAAVIAAAKVGPAGREGGVVLMGKARHATCGWPAKHGY